MDIFWGYFKEVRKGVFSFALIALCFFQTFGETDTYVLSEEDKLFTQIVDVNIATSQGQFKLSDIYDKSPVIIALVFTRCVGVCNPFLVGLAENIKRIRANESFRILVISFDPADSLQDMEQLAQRYSLEQNKQWIFATTPKIDELNSSIGFKAIWDSVRRQFDHEALLVGINENGYITKKLTGLREPKELQAMIKDINNQFVPSYPLPRKNMLFSCFTYEPTTGERKPSTGLFVLLVPAFLTLILLLWFATKKQKER